MKPGDAVKVSTSHGVKFGILITSGRKKYMVGPVVEVFVDGTVQSFLQEKVTIAKRSENES